MRDFFIDKSSDGLTKLSGKKTVGGFTISKNYNYIEVKNKDNYYGCYFIPIGQNETVFLAYLPELWVIDELIENKACLIKFMSRSSRISNILKESISSERKHKGVFFHKITDFTREEQSSWHKCWCIERIVDVSVNKDMFNSGSSQFTTVLETIDIFVDVIKEFRNVVKKQHTDLASSLWMAKMDKELLSTSLSLMEKNRIYPTFINKLCNGSTNLQDFVRKNEIAFLSENDKFYRIGENVPKGDGCMIIIAECFDSSLKGKDYIFIISYNFDGKSKWNLSIDLGDVAEWTRILTKNIDTKNNVKIEPNAFKYMPETCRLLFYTNKNNDGISLRKYVESGDTYRYYDDNDESFQTLEGSEIKYGLWTEIKYENLWLYNRHEHGIQSFVYAIEKGLTITKEVLIYKKVFKKDFAKFVITRLVDGATFWLNPIGKTYKWLKKL